MERSWAMWLLVVVCFFTGHATAFTPHNSGSHGFPRRSPLAHYHHRPLALTTTTSSTIASGRGRCEETLYNPTALSRHHVRRTQVAASFTSSSLGPYLNDRNPLVGATPSKILSTIRGGGGGSTSNVILTALSVAIGYIIITGSLFFKIPQVVRIFRKKSAEGISAQMYSMETIGVAASLLFSIRNAFPFSTYGEAVFILFQNIAILVGMSIYGENPKPPVLGVALVLIAASFVYFLAPSTPAVYVSVLQSLSIPLLNISRIPQIVLNYQRKSTGELAPSTLVLQAAGNLARIFTTLVQVKNRLFLMSALIAMVFNGMLCFQFFLYKDTPKPAVA